MSSKDSDMQSEGEQSTASKSEAPISSEGETTNDGVKILEEVFGKASVADSEETKTTDQKISFGPVPPTDAEFDEAEIAKAEEFKNQGNKYFQGKLFSVLICVKTQNSMMHQMHIQRQSSAMFLL